jgi:hypothetical protein
MPGEAGSRKIVQIGDPLCGTDAGQRVGQNERLWHRP